MSMKSSQRDAVLTAGAATGSAVGDVMRAGGGGREKSMFQLRIHSCSETRMLQDARGCKKAPRFLGEPLPSRRSARDDVLQRLTYPRVVGIRQPRNEAAADVVVRFILEDRDEFRGCCFVSSADEH